MSANMARTTTCQVCNFPTGCIDAECKYHDNVTKWNDFPCYWPFVWGIHRSPVNSPCKGQWRGGLMFSFICAWIYGWVNDCESGDLRRHHAHYDVIVMWCEGAHGPTHNSKRRYGIAKSARVNEEIIASTICIPIIVTVNNNARQTATHCDL